MTRKKPLIIAGPCSAESELQVMSVAQELVANSSVDMFRAGVWKPRTRPNSFEGLGEKALPWLAQIKKQFDLPVMIEVASPKHVELALHHGIDCFWIGARTTVSPFAVQEIADALAGSATQVFVKNPIHPEIDLWVGAIERVTRSNVKSVSAIHRGFSSFRKSAYRNIPLWEIPIELQRRFPDLDIICDPSHIGGNQKLVFEISQKAIDLGLSGLMIEVHPNPSKALSDPQQQITPNELIQLLNSLHYKSKTFSDAFFVNQLEELRSKIDKIDEDLVHILKSRMDLVEMMGAYKRDNDVTIFQLERWNEILQTRTELASHLGLDETYVREIFEKIHGESIKTQIALSAKTTSKE
ncbi:MAG: bifunctional 3-deoxy-7-phosphoheptulonate synthase/chorismate mutase type II [Flavobacteriales bacterium]|nr:bifunctional 3-deoxy-7-phosphoheptulonate synthase/chorismate mutase type II [Flavobacteriales bacterium]